MGRQPPNSRLVYSTEAGRIKPAKQAEAKRDSSTQQTGPSDGIVRIRRETKGRGGKAVTVIAGLPGDAALLKSVAKQLKQRCGVGGAVKGTDIEIQGDQRETCRDTLESLGYPCKLAGG